MDATGIIAIAVFLSFAICIIACSLHCICTLHT